MTLEQALADALATTITDVASFGAAMHLRRRVFVELGDAGADVVAYLDGLLDAWVAATCAPAPRRVARVNEALLPDDARAAYAADPRIFDSIAAGLGPGEAPPIIPGVVWTRAAP